MSLLACNCCLMVVQLYSWLQTTVDVYLTHKMILCQVCQGSKVGIFSTLGRLWWLPRGSRTVLGRGHGCLALAPSVQAAQVCSGSGIVGPGAGHPSPPAPSHSLHGHNPNQSTSSSIACHSRHQSIEPTTKQAGQHSVFLDSAEDTAPISANLSTICLSFCGAGHSCLASSQHHFC